MILRISDVSQDVVTNLRQDDKFLAREVVLLDRLPEDDLRLPVGVHLRFHESALPIFRIDL